MVGKNDGGGCEDRGPEVVALVRGEEFDPSALEALQAHLATCASCRSLAGDGEGVFAAAAARPFPDPFAGLDDGARRRAAAAVAAAAFERAGDAVEPGRLLRLREAVVMRYEESRLVRFLTVSAGLHAAAAGLLGAWFFLSPSSPFHRAATPGTVVAVSGDRDPELEGTNREIPPPSTGSVGAAGDLRFPGAEMLPLPEETALHRPFDLPGRPDFGGAGEPVVHPTEAFRSFASGRFRDETRRRRMEAVYGPEGAATAAAAVPRGLHRLAASQAADGRWGGSAADTAVALQAFMADGSTALRAGPFTPMVRRGVEAISASRHATGLLGATPGGTEPSLEDHAVVLATLAEAYGMDYAMLPEALRSRWKGRLVDAVAATVARQREDGAFAPRSSDAAGDTHTTLLQVEALAMARMVGIPVEDAVFRRAGRFVASMVDGDGRTGRYAPGDRGRDASLSARVLVLAEPLGLDGALCGRLMDRVLEDAASGDLRERALFRADLLELAAASSDGRFRGRLGTSVATTTAAVLRGPDAEPGPHATAVAVRALTAPYRHAAP